MEFMELDEQEFAKFAEHCPVKNFMQSIYMYKRYVKTGKEAYLVGVKAGRKIVAAALIFKMGTRWGRKIFRAPRGILMDYRAKNRLEILQTFTRGARKFLRKKEGLSLQISPDIVSRERDTDGQLIEGGENNLPIKQMLQKLGYKYLGEYEQAKWTYVLPLRGREKQELLASFRKGHKLSIRYAPKRYGVKIRKLKYDELPLLYELVGEAEKKHDFTGRELEYYQEMYRAFGTKVQFLVAEMPDPQTGKIVAVAGSMFLLYGDEVIYLMSGAREEYKKYGGPHFMQWKMIQYAMSHGFERYNFWGTNVKPGNGVYEFKKGFRGQVEELLGTFILPIGVKGRAYIMSKKPAERRRLQ